jgi:hypothetical protein
MYLPNSTVTVGGAICGISTVIISHFGFAAIIFFAEICRRNSLVDGKRLERILQDGGRSGSPGPGGFYVERIERHFHFGHEAEHHRSS